MPIKKGTSTTPGINIFTGIEEDLETVFVLDLDYCLYRSITTDPMFWVSSLGMGLWAIVLIAFVILELEIRKYRLRHERDNEIINESIETFTGFIDAKDPYTNGHSKRVAIYTRLIAEKLGFSGEELDRIYYIALLHDCGKIGVPDNILGKPGRLTDEEFQIIKSHTVRGGEILSRFKSLENAHEGALYHHERYDGNGYPQGLKGEEIPLIARMICVADSFDAMNSNRVYRKKISSEYIIDELKKNSGTQFDPKIANIMLELIAEGKIVMDDID
jgi:HD-GYP domain-containing protein (c-di-GMP phosphodiesterase class II)